MKVRAMTSLITNYNICRNNGNIQQQLDTPRYNTYNYQSDSISFGNSPQQEKQGLSTGIKVAIGIGVAALLSVVAEFVFCKGKHINKLIRKEKG